MWYHKLLGMKYSAGYGTEMFTLAAHELTIDPISVVGNMLIHKLQQSSTFAIMSFAITAFLFCTNEIFFKSLFYSKPEEAEQGNRTANKWAPHIRVLISCGLLK